MCEKTFCDWSLVFGEAEHGGVEFVVDGVRLKL
jgi:hypothetical protein